MSLVPQYIFCGFSNTIFIYFAIPILCLLCSTVILLRYTSVPKVYNSVIANKKPIRNEFWISYFLLVAVFSIFRLLGFAFQNWQIEVASMMIQGSLSYVLVCALQWQRRYRSQMSVLSFENNKETYGDVYNAEDSREPMISSEHETESDSILFQKEKARPFYHNLMSFLFSVEIIGFIFLLYNLISCVIRAIFNDSSPIPKYVQLTAIFLQRMLMLAVLLIIVFLPVSKNHSSPSISVRIVAVIAMFFNLLHDIPFLFWFDWIGTGCYFYFSFYDIISSSFFISLGLWMVFIGAEFHRSREQAMFYAFQVTQSSLEFVTDNYSED